MPLKIFTIRDPANGEEEYQAWMEQNVGIKVQTRHVCPHSDGSLIFDRLYVFYETANDNEYRKNLALIDESAQLEMCRDLANALKNDPVMQKLTNKTQKRLYLLHAKNLPATDADVVMELLSPALRSILE